MSDDQPRRSFVNRSGDNHIDVRVDKSDFVISWRHDEPYVTVHAFAWPMFASCSDLFGWLALHPWMATLYGLVMQESIDEAIDLLFDHVNDLLFEDRADECDELLQAIDLGRLDTNLLVSLLSVTLPARAVLPSRPALVDQVERRLTKLAPTRVDRLLSGLR